MIKKKNKKHMESSKVVKSSKIVVIFFSINGQLTPNSMGIWYWGVASA